MSNSNSMATVKRRQHRLCCNVTSHQLGKIFSSLLIPLMIAVFTIVTTVLQMNLAKQQRQQDLQIAKESHEKDERIEEKRRDAEANAQENQQMNTVLATYLKDMAELMLSNNFTLTNKLITTVIRAKTLTTLGQLDGKRKGHLIRFLYEAQMIIVGQPSNDVTDADLSNVDLTNYIFNKASFVNCNLYKAVFRQTTLRGVDFENAQLITASFDNSDLYNISFRKANLLNASFIGAELFETDFSDSTVKNADFTCVTAPDLICIGVIGNNTIFNGASMEYAEFTDSTLTNASFVGTWLHQADINRATLNKANLTNAELRFTNFDNSELFESTFDGSSIVGGSFFGTNLVATKWFNSSIKHVDFSYANLSSAAISDDQIRQAVKTVNITLPNGSQGFNTNLLKNCDAEGLYGECVISPWHVNSTIAKNYDVVVGQILGKCYFTAESETTQATMWQSVTIPNEYNEWIRTGVAMIWIIGYCECMNGCTMHVRQFDGNNNSSLMNNTLNTDPIHLGSNMGALFPTHKATTEIEFTIVFKGSDGLSKGLDMCDNLKLTIWHRNYTL